MIPLVNNKSYAISCKTHVGNESYITHFLMACHNCGTMIEAPTLEGILWDFFLICVLISSDKTYEMVSSMRPPTWSKVNKIINKSNLLATSGPGVEDFHFYAYINGHSWGWGISEPHFGRSRLSLGVVPMLAVRAASRASWWRYG